MDNTSQTQDDGWKKAMDRTRPFSNQWLTVTEKHLFDLEHWIGLWVPSNDATVLRTWSEHVKDGV